MNNTYKGFFQKYIIRRTDGKPIDPDNKYFVLKYEGDGDEKHMDACRKALRVYAEEVKDFLPDLSKDLFRILGRTPISPSPQTEIKKVILKWSLVLLEDEGKDITYNRSVIQEILADFTASSIIDGSTPISPSPQTREELKEKANQYLVNNFDYPNDNFYLIRECGIRQLMADFALSLSIPPSLNLTHDKLFRGEMTEKAQASMVTDEEIDKTIKRHFHGFTDEQWEELKTTFPYVEIPFIVRDLLTNKETTK